MQSKQAQRDRENVLKDSAMMAQQLRDQKMNNLYIIQGIDEQYD